MDKNSTEGDDTVDTDQDGIPDIIELKGSYKVSVKNPFTGEMQEVDTWSIYCNPAKADSDGDGLDDIDDLQPMKYDTVVVESDDSCIKFNTGRIWYNIKHDAHDYFMDVELADSRPLAIYSDDIISDTKNRNQDFTIEELCYIGLMNTEGSKIYMDDKSGAVREAVFQILTGRESKYFRHVGIFETEDWVEVPAGTESGFFSGKVLSEADMNFSHALSSYIDFSRVMSTLYLEGALILTMLFAAGAIEAAPYILANFQALTHYVKTFGVRQGLDMYRYLGVQNLPNGVISWLQMDMADGDSSLDDLALSGVKYNKNDVVWVARNSDGKLMWLENGNSKAGLNHIQERHAADFSAKGVNNISTFLKNTIKSTPVRTGGSAKGLYADYLMNGVTYRVAYGTNGYIVSFYPID